MAAPPCFRVSKKPRRVCHPQAASVEFWAKDTKLCAQQTVSPLPEKPRVFSGRHKQSEAAFWLPRFAI